MLRTTQVRLFRFSLAGGAVRLSAFWFVPPHCSLSCQFSERELKTHRDSITARENYHLNLCIKLDFKRVGVCRV